MLFKACTVLDIDDCVDNKCENGAACVDDVNTYSCDCKDDFNGDFCECKLTIYLNIQILYRHKLFFSYVSFI